MQTYHDDCLDIMMKRAELRKEARSNSTPIIIEHGIPTRKLDFPMPTFDQILTESDSAMGGITGTLYGLLIASPLLLTKVPDFMYRIRSASGKETLGNIFERYMQIQYPYDISFSHNIAFPKNKLKKCRTNAIYRHVPEFNPYDSIEPVAVVQSVDIDKNGHVYYRVSGDWADVITNYKAWQARCLALHREMLESLQQTRYCGIILDNKKEAEQKLHNKDTKSYPWSDENNDIYRKSREGNSGRSQMVPKQFRAGLRNRRGSGDR